jgi:tRNA threonylcarbamoyladenosine biosynthesis protein TsaE
MNFKTEQEMIDFGQSIGEAIIPPLTIELIGDVGSGKTTITKGIAKGLGVKSEVTSPSFTISKQYAFPLKTQGSLKTQDDSEPRGILAHYDFYRLQDPGLMSEDLDESISDEKTITIVEWAGTVENILPEDRIVVKITTEEDGSRTIETKNLAKFSDNLISNSEEN